MSKAWMCLIAVVTLATIFGMGNARAQQAAQKNPPFEVYLHTTTENGNLAMVIRYHADGTFELERGQARGRMAIVTPALQIHRMMNHKTGRWWWSADGRFCFQIEGRNPYCKANGHYIGQTPIN